MYVKSKKMFSMKSLLFLIVLLLCANYSIATPVLSKDLAHKQFLNLKTKPFARRQPLPIRSADEEVEGEKDDDQSSGSQEITSTKTSKLPLLGGATLFVLPLQQKSLPRSWCKTRQFRQKIHHHGCRPVYITNSMCFGQCQSFFIPKLFHSCASCLPKEKYTKTVMLTCADRTQPLVKEVNVVKSCSCQACERSKIYL